MNEKIYAAIILEMMGRPMDHLQSAAEELVESLGKEKGIRITSKVIHEVKKVENKDKTGKIIEVPEEQQLFSTFAELEMEADNLNTLIVFCFKYMPSHIEIIEPESIVINNYEIGGILNEIVTKLHNYDAVAKSAIMQNQMMAKRLQEMLLSKQLENKLNNKESEDTNSEEKDEEKA
jgi:hypothetical protein